MESRLHLSFAPGCYAGQLAEEIELLASVHRWERGPQRVGAPPLWAGRVTKISGTPAIKCAHFKYARCIFYDALLVYD